MTIILAQPSTNGRKLAKLGWSFDIIAGDNRRHKARIYEPRTGVEAPLSPLNMASIKQSVTYFLIWTSKLSHQNRNIKS